jgi:hypothetical protein
LKNGQTILLPEHRGEAAARFVGVREAAEVAGMTPAELLVAVQLGRFPNPIQRIPLRWRRGQIEYFAAGEALKACGGAG